MYSFNNLFVIAVLQPTPNEYNINERIKEANQELYSTPYQDTDFANRKVRFRDTLEDFEPEESDDEQTEKNSSQSSVVSHHSKSKEEVIMDEIDKENDELNVEEIDEILSKNNDDMDYTGDDVSEICEQIEEMKAKSDDESTDKLDVEDDIHSHKSSKSDSTVEELENNNATNDVIPCCGDHKTKKASYIQKCLPKKLTKKSGKVNPTSSDDDAKDRKHKTCCQHKHSDDYIQKLPRYNGQNSVYGLSQEQLEKREYNLQKSIHMKQVKGKYRSFFFLK